MFNCTNCFSLGFLSINGWVKSHYVLLDSYFHLKLLTSTYSQFSALFLSEKAPFDFPGFSIMCIGIASVRTLIEVLHSLYLFIFFQYVVDFFLHICIVLSCDLNELPWYTSIVIAGIWWCLTVVIRSQNTGTQLESNFIVYWHGHFKTVSTSATHIHVKYFKYYDVGFL